MYITSLIIWIWIEFFKVLYYKYYIILIFFTGGKRDETLILPANDSISATLDTDHVKITNIYKVKYK